MSMRVALVYPSSASRPVAEIESCLGAGLAAQGATLTRFACPASAAGEAQVLARLCSSANSFDLAHSLLGQRTLLWARSIALPFVVTSLGAQDDLSDIQLDAAPRAGRERVFWVGQAPPMGRSLLAQIDHGKRDTLAHDYARAYAQALELDRRQRMDSEHDARPWGEYFVLEDSAGHKVKRIDVLVGQRLSYQKHAQRSEHWMIVRGQALVVLDGKEHHLRAGQTIDIPAGTAHRIGNPGPAPMSFIEVQTGPYLGEDDIVRLQDDYKR